MGRFPLAVALALFSSSKHAEPHLANSASDVFERLKSLQGDWKMADPKRATAVNYRLIANGTTLVETWTMSPTRQSMTVYTMDGDQLIATYYCPQGNASRLKFDSVDSSRASRFVFFDGANLQNPDGSHEHAFWVRLDGSNRMTRSETFISNSNSAAYDPARDEGAEETFERVK